MARLHPPLLLLLAATLLTAGLTAACTQESRTGEIELPEPDEAPAAEVRAPAPWPDSAVREVLAMEAESQRVREGVAALIQGPRPDTAALRAAAAEQAAVDRVNTERLKALIQEHGWPSKTDVGSDAASAAFLLVQHASHDLAFQKEYLAFLQLEFRTGDAPGEAIALLTDLTRLAEGMPQLYGTQMTIQDRRLVLDPIEDEARVDERRAELGLGPLSEYMERMRQAYGLPR